MKLDSIPDGKAKERILKSKNSLGLWQQEDQPLIFSYTDQVLDKRLQYNDVLEKNVGFHNPNNVEALTQQLGLSNHAGSVSLFSSLRNGR